MRNMNKFHAKKIVVPVLSSNGDTYIQETFDSQKEYRRWCELKLLENAGEIFDLHRQVKYVLIPTQKINGKVVERECSYLADFVYIQDGNEVVEDTKGFKTDAYIIKRKLMLDRFGIRIKET